MPEQENNPQRIPVNPNTWIILGCIIVLVMVMSTAMFYMIKHVKELTSSPFIYGAQKQSEKYQGAGLMCTCKMDIPTTNALGREVRDPIFYFNTTSIWIQEHETVSIASGFNSSIIQGLLTNSTP